MSDSASRPYPPAAASQDELRNLTILVYGLYLGGAVTCGLAGLAGVILAYIKRDETVGTIWHSHFENAIQAFWAWLGIAIVGAVLTPVLIGFPILGIAVIYFLYRTIKGLIRAVESQPYV